MSSMKSLLTRQVVRFGTWMITPKTVKVESGMVELSGAGDCSAEFNHTRIKAQSTFFE